MCTVEILDYHINLDRPNYSVFMKSDMILCSGLIKEDLFNRDLREKDLNERVQSLIYRSLNY